MSRKSIAVIGAGPIGIESALYAKRLGHDVQAFERGTVGDNIRRWGFVKLFSAAGLNRSALGTSALRKFGRHLPQDDAYLSGTEHVETYLMPLCRTPALRGRIHERHRVVQIGRERIGKGLPLGSERAAHPFRLLVEGPGGERTVRADVVLDCSGTYGNPRWLGSGNIPAPGERAAASMIAYTLQDIDGVDRGRYAGRRVLLVGSGHSAATALDALADLSGTQTVWVTRATSVVPCNRFPDDPLPERDRLSARANALAIGAPGATGSVSFMPGTCVEALRPTVDGLSVLLSGTAGEHAVVVDTVLAHVGYQPDTRLYRELQVHECYATQGPMNLAALLLGSASADCLAQAPAGADTLVNPEPDFYILGAKSYGRNSQFLIRLGLTQVREVFKRIEGRPELNLYAAPLEEHSSVD